MLRRDRDDGILDVDRPAISTAVAPPSQIHGFRRARRGPPERASGDEEKRAMMHDAALREEPTASASRHAAVIPAPVRKPGGE
jgi:hypothetical protein